MASHAMLCVPNSLQEDLRPANNLLTSEVTSCLASPTIATTHVTAFVTEFYYFLFSTIIKSATIAMWSEG
jgi:hypothetical protein